MFPKVYVRVITVLAAGLLPLLFLPTGFGQNRGGATPPSTGTPPGSTGTPAPTTGTGRTPTTIPNNTNTPNTQTPLPQPIFVSGRVMIDDGTPLPEAVVIQRVCNGSAHAEGYTDSKGYFGIELGSKTSAAFQDASEFSPGGGLGPTNGLPGQSQLGRNAGGPDTFSDRRTLNCELQAKLAGYRSQVVSLTNRRPMDDPNVGTILLHRMGNAEGTTVSAVSL